MVQRKPRNLHYQVCYNSDGQECTLRPSVLPRHSLTQWYPNSIEIKCLGVQYLSPFLHVTEALGLLREVLARFSNYTGLRYSTCSSALVSINHMYCKPGRCIPPVIIIMSYADWHPISVLHCTNLSLYLFCLGCARLPHQKYIPLFYAQLTSSVTLPV